jgi:hypothetical protein
MAETESTTIPTALPAATETAGSPGDGSGTIGNGTTATAQDPRQDALLQAGQQGNILDWRHDFPDNLKQAGIVQQHHTREAAAKTLVSQAEMLGRSLGFLPREEPGTEAHIAGMQKIYDKLGRPDKADAYELAVPEGVQLDAEIGTRWKQAFYKAGLSQAQVAEVMGEYWRTVEYGQNQRVGQAERSFTDGRNALYGEFGGNTERMLNMANGFFDHMGAGAFNGEGGPKAIQAIQRAVDPETGARLINDPHFVACLAEAGRRMGEGEWRESELYQAGKSQVESIQEEVNRLQALRNAGQPHDMTRLLELRDRLQRAETQAQVAGWRR